MSVLNAPHFHNEEAAYAFVEAHVWPDGRVCPHCGSVDHSGKLKGKSTRIGVYKCYDCRKPFTVKVGTIFEASHVKLHLWLQAIYLMCASKKGISSNQLHRTLGVTLKTAWFMSHRIREAMRDAKPIKLGGHGKTVEVDETFWGVADADHRFVTGRGWVRKHTGSGYAHKDKILTLVERGGRARSFHVPDVKASTLRPILEGQIDKASSLMTDAAQHYKGVGREFAKHESVDHSIGEYVRGEATTNTIEGYFSILKRGLGGVYQHVSSRHLKRYVCEFDFRYNERTALGVDDEMRTSKALKGIVGKRLTYRTTNSRVSA